MSHQVIRLGFDHQPSTDDRNFTPAQAAEFLRKLIEIALDLMIDGDDGHKFDDPRSGTWGGNVSVVGADKNSIATLNWVKPEEFESRTLMNKSKIKATNGKDEVTLGGKGRYQEWDASDPKENRHFVDVYVKTEKNTLQCTGSTPKGDTAKIATLQALCKSMAPK